MAQVEREYYTCDKQGELGHIGVRKTTVIERNGIEGSTAHHRHVIDPDSDLTDEPDEVKAVAEAYWTDDLVANWKDRAALEA